MNNLAAKAAPPDLAERVRALDPANSILVQAPAGSGKTDLLTRRFLCLLAGVEEPEQIVAITFTKAAAAEMRHRILSKLEDAAGDREADAPIDAFSMEALARRVLLHSQALGWNLLEQPARLRISTIDSFCRELALQRPLISGLGDGLDITDEPDELYRRAARRTLEELDMADPLLRSAIGELLLWRDNNWQELEKLLVEMLKTRDRWMHGFVLERDPDAERLREHLERPFRKAVSAALGDLSRLLDLVPEAREEVLGLALFAREHGGGEHARLLAEMGEFPCGDFAALEVIDPEFLQEACQAHIELAGFLLTGGNFRRAVNRRHGFPAEYPAEKERFLKLVERLSAIPGLDSALAAVQKLPPARYPDEEWRILRDCFTLLRNAAGQLRVVFAEAGKVDYIEVAQIAQNVLTGPDGMPSDAALVIGDRIRHILVDEFQDTSRRQHELLRRLIAAWPEREGRSCFVVGDPMQSIYFFRDADAELFPRVRAAGLEIPGAEDLLFESVALTSNFRTAKPLVKHLNQVFEAVFAINDGSGVTFTPAEPAREEQQGLDSGFALHLKFEPQSAANKPDELAEHDSQSTDTEGQVGEIVSLIRSRMPQINEARARGATYRIAVLGRARPALAPIAQALRKARIAFRSVDLEQLSDRPEVLDALALARAFLNPLDRLAWLGVLRAPWCGLSLSDLHILTSADDPELLARPVPDLIAERNALLSRDGRIAVLRLLDGLSDVAAMRFVHPSASLGTWLEQLWLRLGGRQCVDAAAEANLDLLWQALDSLPNGEQDLLGPALKTALEKLTAQPDPAADSVCGVQLMTIHKSKGLEFEVVIVAELQAGTRKGTFRMLSWLERGLAPNDIAESVDGLQEVTEFLVAPLQSRGSDRGKAKAWVDRVYQQHELQEMRRLLYVAATRAREELHLFARPPCKQNRNGEWELSVPSGTLLATAWPALQAEIEGRFAKWKTKQEKAKFEPAETVMIEAVAASAQGNLFEMPALWPANRLRRLPASFRNPQSVKADGGASGPAIVDANSEQHYQRHEGGLLSRARGIAVHTLLERLARLRQTQDWDTARAALSGVQPQVAAQIRAVGIAAQQADRLAKDAVEIATRASHDAIGQWILSPHPQAASEMRWVGVVDGQLRTVQVDRIFCSGAEPQSAEGSAWWIIDYKTAHDDGRKAEVELARLREIFAPQLVAYADLLRKLRGNEVQIRAGLYYPRRLKFDWWEI